MVKMYAGETQAVLDTFAKHATVVSSREFFLLFASRFLILHAGQSNTNRHGVAAPNLFVAFNDVEDASKVLSTLDGKVTVNDHQYDLAYGRERARPPKPSRPSKPSRSSKPSPSPAEGTSSPAY